MWAALVALWPALGVVLGSPWRLLGPSWASRGAPRRLAGELREVILEGILKVEPEIWENHKVLTCSMVKLRLLLVSFLVVCCLSRGAPGAGAYLENTGFRMEGVSIFAFGPSARAAQQPRKRDEKSIAKSQNAQRTAHAERTRTNVQKSSFLEPQALQNRPQASPKQPRKRLEAAG